MPRKMALVDFAFVEELSEGKIRKKDKRYFRAKVKDSLEHGSKRDKKLEKIRHLLLAATKGDKKPDKKKGSGKSLKPVKPNKRAKTFTQFDTGSTSGSGSSSDASSDSESESPENNAKQSSEASSGSSGSESDKGEGPN